MKIKFIALFFITLFVNQFTKAQTSESEIKSKEIKYGKISPEEFKVIASGKDSAANAIVIADIGSINFTISNTGGWVYQFERHRRIKILKKEGAEYANFSIPIYASNNLKEKLVSISYTAYNLENNKVIQTKSNKAENFVDKVNENWTNYKYTLSNIQEGTILDLKYTIESEDIYNLRSWNFQEDIPVLWSDFTVAIPDYFRYKNNLQQLSVVHQIPTKTSVTSFSGRYSNGAQASESYEFQSKTETFRWIAKDVYSFKNEPFITTDKDYISRITFELNSLKFPNSMVKNYSNNWEVIIKDLKENSSFGGLLNQNNYTKELTEQITKGLTNDLDKAKAVLNYLKKEVKWNNRNSIYAVNKNVKNVLESKIGNSADINLSVVNLLNNANIKSYPVLISTRSNGKHPGIPLLSPFNYVIAAFLIGEEVFFIDATSPYASIDLINHNSLNHNGYLVDINNQINQWIDISPKKPSKEQITNTFTINQNLELEGNTTIRTTNYSCISSKINFNNNKEEYIKKLKNNHTGLNILDLETLENDNEFSLSYKSKISDFIESTGNVIYFNPLIHSQIKDNPFKNDERNFPIDFAYDSETNYRLIFTIPEGYQVEKLPVSQIFKLNDNSASFNYNVISSGNQILIQSKVTFLKTIYPVEEYKYLKEIYKNIVELHSQPIVLKKI